MKYKQYHDYIHVLKLPNEVKKTGARDIKQMMIHYSSYDD